ncbi:hypothetical protein PLICRDRAFT_286657 [Plicaturopsis crispa FD-325 SS-3]|nr:hypothetical protein PLICRDRAFT_286657 [Plicaturopsis crispa FD-325 SS-3]
MSNDYQFHFPPYTYGYYEQPDSSSIGSAPPFNDPLAPPSTRQDGQLYLPIPAPETPPTPALLYPTDYLPSPTDSSPSPSTPASLASTSSTPSLSPYSPKSASKKARKTVSSTSRRTREGHIPRPPNAFFVFRSELAAAKMIPSSVEHDHRHISIILGHRWRMLSDAEKQPFKDKASALKAQHMIDHPDYHFAPSASDRKPIKRKVNRNTEEDLRRDVEIAKRLMVGKVGEALVEEFGKKDTDASTPPKKKRAPRKSAPRKPKAKDASPATPPSVHSWEPMDGDAEYVELQPSDASPFRDPLRPPTAVSSSPSDAIKRTDYPQHMVKSTSYDGYSYQPRQQSMLFSGNSNQYGDFQNYDAAPQNACAQADFRSGAFAAQPPPPHFPGYPSVYSPDMDAGLPSGIEHFTSLPTPYQMSYGGNASYDTGIPEMYYPPDDGMAAPYSANAEWAHSPY